MILKASRDPPGGSWPAAPLENTTKPALKSSPSNPSNTVRNSSSSRAFSRNDSASSGRRSGCLYHLREGDAKPGQERDYLVGPFGQEPGVLDRGQYVSDGWESLAVFRNHGGQG